MLKLLPWWANLIVLGVVLAALFWAWTAFTGHYKQIGKDSRNEEVAQLMKERDDSRAAERSREAETAQCVAQSKIQSYAVLDLQRQTQAAQGIARQALEQARAESVKTAARDTELRRYAAAVPRQQSCEATLKAADSIARESAMGRRKP